MGDLSTFSIENIEQVISTCRGLENFLEQITPAKSYEEFVQRLYRKIDSIVFTLQENSELYQVDQGEDRLTVEIRNNLRHAGFDASHDEKYNGHADLIVRSGEYVWIGEAKVHKGYEYLWKGFCQLATRYSTGASNQLAGGILIYIFNKDARSVMKRWEERLTGKNLPDFSCKSCQHNLLAFFSIHRHNKSGMPFTVRHVPVLLFFEPQDR